jgi:hypothetical protein
MLHSRLSRCYAVGLKLPDILHDFLVADPRVFVGCHFIVKLLYIVGYIVVPGAVFISDNFVQPASLPSIAI